MPTSQKMAIRTIGGRLREERKRLGLSQQKLATAVGISRNSQVNYEADKRSPNAAYWSALAMQCSMDIQYILTGIRSENLDKISKKPPKTSRNPIVPAGYSLPLCGHDISIHFRLPHRFFVSVAEVAAAIKIETSALRDAISLGPQGNMVPVTALYHVSLNITCPHQLAFLKWAKRIYNRQLSILHLLNNRALLRVADLTPSLAEAYVTHDVIGRREREIIHGATNPDYLDIDLIVDEVVKHWKQDPTVQAWIPQTLRNDPPTLPELHLPAGLIFEKAKTAGNS